MIRRSTQSRRQPVFRLSINPRYAQYVSTARVWNLPPTLDVDARLDKISAFAKTGTIDVATSAGGVGVKGNGATGYYSRAISFIPQAMWMAAQFVVNSTSTSVVMRAYALGSAASGTSAYAAIGQGTGSSAELFVQFRAVDGGSGISKIGPAPVVGQVYTVVAVYPSALKADAYMYVNGVKYNTDFGSSADITFVGAANLVNEAVGALKRDVAVNFSSDTVLFTARGVGQIPEALARQISLNPYILLQPQQHSVFDIASGSTTGAGSSTITFACNGIGSALFKGIGSSTITFNGSAVGVGAGVGVGASTITFNASGVGIGSGIGAGNCAITFNCAGVGSSIGFAPGGGSSSISFNVSGIGSSLFNGVGSATFTLTANGVGSSIGGSTTLTPAVGSATMSFNATGYGNALQSYTWNDITYSSSTWTDIQPPSDIWTDIITT